MSDRETKARADIRLMQGDCLQQMRSLPDNSVDSIVTDPPYGISFMAKKWDYDVPSVKVWQEAMRVLKPGGHALIACGTRTQHRMVVNIEDAGFEIRDVVSWVYGSGFPKSLNVSKAIDKAAGAEREVVEWKKSGGGRTTAANPMDRDAGKTNSHDPITAPATDAAKQWDGWGSALKPAVEFFTLCRKPLSEKTIAANVLKWTTGGINVDGCRVGTEDNLNGGRYSDGKKGDDGNSYGKGINERSSLDYEQPQGRFPANLIHDGSEEVVELFPETKPSKASKRGDGIGKGFGGSDKAHDTLRGHSDQGSAARFFYCPKASKKDRDGSTHPTMKPTALMQYLCRLITPTGGTVMDPYMGSGSTGKAAIYEGFGFVGMEKEEEFFDIATARIDAARERIDIETRQGQFDL